MPLACLDHRQRRRLDVAALGEADRRRRGLAVRAERGRDRRAGDLLVEVGLALGDARHAGHQAARRRVRLDRRAGADAEASRARPRAARRAAASAAAASWPAFPHNRSRAAVHDPWVTGAGDVGLGVGLGDGHGQLADAQDVGGALGDADAAARVEHVEEVRALEALLERRDDQPGVDQLLATNSKCLSNRSRWKAANSPGARPGTSPNAYFDCSTSSRKRTSRYGTPGAHSRS